MSSLWQRLKLARQKSDMSISEAWDELQKLGRNSGKGDQKMQVLMNFLLQPGDAWKNHLCREVKRLTHKQERENESELFTKGELV
eukprot:126351-Alexandrium_andersonii.AAC.1